MSTYVPIQAITLSATASSIEFTGIPQTYTDLVVVLEAKTSALVDTCIRYNGDTGTNYSFTRLIGNGSTASSSRNSNFSRILMGDSDTGASMVNTIHIQNYSNTITNKTTLVRSNKADRIVFAIAALWRNTAAITSMTLFPDSGTFSSGSTFTLYGVGTGSPLAFGGDEVRTDGTYWYHIYRSSGRFEPVTTLSVDYLVAAGGGGGAVAGGGAGGLKNSTAFSVTANTNYTVTVGGGGAGSGASSGPGASGGGSAFGSITTSGGGGGGGIRGVNHTTTSGVNGGSGGGGGTVAGTGVSGEGNAGGTNIGGSGANNTGGGGGKGSAGVNGASSTGGAGGSGLDSSITGISTNYSAGGGGSGSVAGGAGGGSSAGAGAPATTNNAPSNQGGGGGGRWDNNSTAGNGGSGIVIIRYSAV